MPPNVLFVIADDQRPDTVGPFDDGTVSTPNLDELAESGCALRPYTTTPVCTPGRGEVLSGANTFENGCQFFDQPIRDEMTLLPEALSAAGYETFLTGKWHNEPGPSAAGFDRVTDLTPDGPTIQNSYFEDGHTYRVERDGIEYEDHGTELITQRAEEFVRSRPDTPWFCMVSTHAPHDPFTPPPAFDRYDPADVEIPSNFTPEHPFDNGDVAVRDEYTEPWPRTPDMVRELRAGYHGLISHLDYRVGRLLTALEATGQRDETIIVFTSDHGLAVGSHGLLGKENLYEHSARVPLVLDGPGIEAGRAPGVLCGHYDLYPTLFDLLDLETPDSVTGGSFALILRGETDGHRDYVFGAYLDHQRMARDDRWKLLYYPVSDEIQLFDLETDPNETRNLLAGWRPFEPAEWDHSWMPDYEPPASRDAVESAVSRLWGELETWSDEVGDDIELPTVDAVIPPEFEA